MPADDRFGPDFEDSREGPPDGTFSGAAGGSGRRSHGYDMSVRTLLL